VTVIAEAYNGKKHQLAQRRRPASGRELRFTDHALTAASSMRALGCAGRAEQHGGTDQPRLGQPPEIGRGKRELPTNVYRVDRSGEVDLVVSENQVPDPNGLVFSPDYKKLYVISTGKGPGTPGPGQGRDVRSSTWGADNKALQPEALQQLHDRRGQVRAGRRAPVTWTQRLVLEQCRRNVGL
jgi:gluconolactonase